jgi:hypothetical protein
VVILGLFFSLAWSYQLTDNYFHEECASCSNKLSLKTLIGRAMNYTGFSLIAYVLHLGKVGCRRRLELELSKNEQTQAELRALQARVNPAIPHVAPGSRFYASDEHFISGFAYENDTSDEKTTLRVPPESSHGELLV